MLSWNTYRRRNWTLISPRQASSATAVPVVPPLPGDTDRLALVVRRQTHSVFCDTTWCQTDYPSESEAKGNSPFLDGVIFLQMLCRDICIYCEITRQSKTDFQLTRVWNAFERCLKYKVMHFSTMFVKCCLLETSCSAAVGNICVRRGGEVCSQECVVLLDGEQLGQRGVWCRTASCFIPGASSWFNGYSVSFLPPTAFLFFFGNSLLVMIMYNSGFSQINAGFFQAVDK